MKAIARCALFILIIGCFGGRTLGDGKFFVEKVPPDIPYQRAFILFHEDSETLVLQSKYELSQSEAIDSLGWVVPVPSVPEIASADADATWISFYKASVHTQPKVTRISGFIFPITVIFFFGCIGFLVVLFVEYLFLNTIRLPKAAWQRRLWISLLTTLIVLFLMMSTRPLFFKASFGVEVEIVKAEKAGIYDVKVIRSQSAEAILGWLTENGFGFNEDDTHIFKDYIDRGWCFVVAKVEPAPEIEEHKIVVEGMVAPLILKFEAEKAVYPLVLTSTIGSETEILLYTFSEKKLDCGKRLTLRYAGKKKSTYFMVDLLSVAEPETSVLFENIPKFMYLCKFRKKLKPEEMKTDLEFEFAKDNQPYREKKIMW
ncbi:MAG TPA: hypothetical protein DIU00_10420 [Phycisphaerales bacterium]|nr:hypothetical protein [Phycisphaerales bacterium]